MGNFQIVRVEKVKTMGSLASRGRHNFREQATPNADENRLDLNVVEGAKNTDELLKAVSDLLPMKRRKDAVIGLEYLITASPEHFGSDWEQTKNYGQDYFKDAVAWLEEKHGKGNVVCTTVHLDESTPHMCAFVVPLVAGKLNAKAFTGGAKVLADMQTNFNDRVGIKHGLERGEFRSKAVHQDNAKIKPMVAERLELRKQVKALMAEVDRLEKAVGGGSAALAAAQDALAKMQERYEAFKARAHAAVDEANRITNALSEEKKAMAKELQTASARDHQLVAEITELRKTNANAVASIEQLHAVNRVLVDQARERLAAEAAQQTGAEPVVQEIDLDACKALQESFGAVKEASKGNLENGRVVGAVNGLVVLHIGMGVHVFHKLPAGSQLPVVGKPLNEQQRGGRGGRAD